MPTFVWKRPPMEVIQAYDGRHPEVSGVATAPIAWAAWTVESLHYLHDLDDLIQERYPAKVNGHDADKVDIGHVRWATGTAITAIDLCAAALGDLFCGTANHRRKLDLRSFASTSASKQVVQRRASLVLPGRNWIDAVEHDQRYIDIHDARNPFTHSWLARNVTVGAAPGHKGRTGFQIRQTEKHINARELIVLSTSLATDQVTAFLDVIDGL